MTALTFAGAFEGSGAFPTLNRHLADGLERRGWQVLRNQHNIGSTLTPYLISSTYPPAPPNMRHERNVCLSTWEFLGRGATPYSFLKAFGAYEVVWAFCQQAATVFRRDGATNVVAGYLGVDPSEFYPVRLTIDDLDDLADTGLHLNVPADATILLWVGGTDARHGFDLALETLKRLPDNFWLVAKQSIHYPPAEAEHERLVIIRTDLKSLAPLYRLADILLHPARAVGPSLPVMEALACGLTVVSTALPAVMELAAHECVRPYVRLVRGRCVSMRHHLHADCNPSWLVPSPDDLARRVLEVSQTAKMHYRHAQQFGALWSWDDAAHHLERTLLGDYDEH